MATAHLIVSALLRRDGRILLVREQGPDDAEPTWMLPGGRVEAGESVLEAVRRELLEETGLRLTGEPRLAFAAHVIGADDGYIALTFACDAEGELRPADPDGLVLEAAWVERGDALARLDLVPWYEAGPLRRHLDGDLGGALVSVVDRR